jgi:hypothetical protein
MNYRLELTLQAKENYDVAIVYSTAVAGATGTPKFSKSRTVGIAVIGDGTVEFDRLGDGIGIIQPSRPVFDALCPSDESR